MPFGRPTLHRVFVLAFAPLLLLVSPPATAASLAQDLLKAAKDQRQMITGVVEAMPEVSFQFKPTEAQRTFAEAALHIAGANSFLTGFTGAKTEGPAVDMSKYQTHFGLEAETKEEVLAALATGYDHLEAALAEFDDAAMLEEVKGPPWVGNVTRASMFHFLLSHNLNIYGQMVVYLRLECGTPPGSGG